MARTNFIAAALALAITLPAVPAQALVARTFVSAAGSDSNNCANVVLSYGDNNIDGNGSANTEPPSPLPYK